MPGDAEQPIKYTVTRDVKGRRTGFPGPQSAQAPAFTLFPANRGNEAAGRSLADAGGGGRAGEREARGASREKPRAKPPRVGAEVSGPGFPPGRQFGLPEAGRDGRTGPPDWRGRGRAA